MSSEIWSGFSHGVVSVPVSLTWEELATGGVALRTLGHSSVAVGDSIYVYGGTVEGVASDDLMVFNTGQSLPVCRCICLSLFGSEYDVISCPQCLVRGHQ